MKGVESFNLFIISENGRLILIIILINKTDWLKTLQGTRISKQVNELVFAKSNFQKIEISFIPNSDMNADV